MKTISLFKWFREFLSAAFRQTLSGNPEDVLSQIHAPPEKYPWVGEMKDEEYPLIERGDIRIPDLEARSRAFKRRAGQYYTPEPLIDRLFFETRILDESPEILDPACGDGAFLSRAIIWKTEHRLPCNLSSFHGYDLDPQALLLCLARLLSLGGSHEWPTLEIRDFLQNRPERKFSRIIGNPPYRVNLPVHLREELKMNFETAEGEKDLYTFFLEGAVKALKPDGRALMLTSHTYLVNHQCRKIREFLFEKHRPRSLFLLPTAFFPSARGVLPVILDVENSHSQGKKFRLFDDYHPENGWRKVFEADPVDFKHPTGLRFSQQRKEFIPFFSRMETTGTRLGNLAHIGVGIQESSHRGTRVSRYVHDDYRPGAVKVLRGREIAPFRVSWEGKFLDYGPHLTYAGKPDIFDNPKILYQNIRNESLPCRLVAALDLQGFYPKNSLSYIADPKPPVSLLYLLGVINSPLINQWFREHFFSFHITVTQVRQVPIAIAEPRLIRKVETIVESIISEESPPDRLQLQTLSETVVECYFPDKGEQRAILSILAEGNGSSAIEF